MEVFKDEFIEFFRKKGYNDEEIETLWLLIISRSGIVKLGVLFEGEGLPPKKIINRPFNKLIK